MLAGVAEDIQGPGADGLPSMVASGVEHVDKSGGDFVGPQQHAAEVVTGAHMVVLILEGFHRCMLGKMCGRIVA